MKDDSSNSNQHSSRGVLPTVVRRCVWYRNLIYEETNINQQWLNLRNLLAGGDLITLGSLQLKTPSQPAHQLIEYFVLWLLIQNGGGGGGEYTEQYN